MFNKITSKYFKGKNNLENVDKSPKKESATKIPKKGEHEPTKYFEDEKLNNTEKLTESKINNPEEFNEVDIENLCSKYLMNIIYYKMAKKRKRQEALEVAANIILKKGEEIKNQLNQNDLDIKNSAKDSGQKSGQVNESNPKGGKADIPKISGGTLSEVIAKMTEMLSGKTGDDLQKGANNLGAMFEVLSAPEIGQKFSDVMQHLAIDPILVADIRDILKDTKAAGVFEQAMQNHLTPAQQKDVNSVSQADIGFRRQENSGINFSNQQDSQQR